MPRRLALTIDADDGRLTNVRKSIGRIHTCFGATVDSTLIDFFGRENCFSSRDTASVAPTEPMP